MAGDLTTSELVQLVRRVFQPTAADRGLAVIVDLPDARRPDHPDWALRRALAAQWVDLLDGAKHELDLDRVTLAYYPNVGGNNADLPDRCFPGAPDFVPTSAGDLAGRPGLSFAQLFAEHSLVLAPTELSATAPLKVATREGGFRAATMPGFLVSMIPALKLDYGEIGRRVGLLKTLLDAAHTAVIRTAADGQEHELVLDLRHREGHASGGVFPANGTAGNLPSGEAYIVPYEGEIDGDPSRTQGVLPVQLGEELALLEIAGNRVRAVRGEGEQTAAEREHFAREPAYANVAELGLGVLGDFGLKPTGSILLDEKLGLHVAFGRSDHFGGTVGPGDFSSPDAVIHLDRVYIPETQPRVTVQEVWLEDASGARTLMRDGAFAEIF